LLSLAAMALLRWAAPAFEARASAAELSEYTRSNYTKCEYQIPMRDGVKLFTAVYEPKDRRQAYPILMLRTPYSIGWYGSDSYPDRLGPSELFTREGFIFVYQDVRGRGKSEGVFVDMPRLKEKQDSVAKADESTDTYDTIDWLIKNVPNNNGRVGTWGISYPGFFSAVSLIHAHPALKAASPQAPMADVGNGDDAYHNGAFFLAANFRFYTGFWPRGPDPSNSGFAGPFDYGTADQYEFFLRLGPITNAETVYFDYENEYWTATVSHPRYEPYWSARALGPQMKNVKAAVLVVGGWFDAEDLGGTPKLFQALERDGHTAANTLVMGPWTHESWSVGDGDRLGNLMFVEKTGAFYRESIELPFFVEHLKGKRAGLRSDGRVGDGGPTKAWMFETGSNRWRRFAAWPPREVSRLSLYLAPGGRLSMRPSEAKANAFEEYVSDPANPVPVREEIGEGMPADYMTHDQRFASCRPDVLTYESEPLTQPITIAGPVTVALRVATSGTDSDFDVKLIDVYPEDTPDPSPNPRGVHMGGYQQMVRGEPFRGKYRRSLSKPEPFKPNRPEPIEFAMPDVLHTFLPGHRIMVQVQSSWFPLTDRNPQRFVEIPTARAEDFQKATQRLYLGGAKGSHLEVTVIQ
jgi:uncharacterized protein